MSHPHIIFGCALIGMHGFMDDAAFRQVAEMLRDGGVSQLDTAARYPPPKQGESERLIGSVRAGKMGFRIDTKILMGFNDGSDELSSVSIARSILESHERLQVNKVRDTGHPSPLRDTDLALFNTLYCHRFDPKTPLAETAAAMHRHFHEGAFERWGVCRFSPEKLEELLGICEENGYVKPAVYQGEYNVLTRGMEKSVLPILRRHHMHYNAHRPFAAGFLTGNFTRGNTDSTRFGIDFPLHKVFHKDYDAQQLHDAVEELTQLLVPHSISSHEAGLRWVLYHSQLGPDDGVIFGASSTAQILSNLAYVGRGPLPTEVASSMDRLWDALRLSRELLL